MNFDIAIDGPAGAGKSTVAKKLAAMLGFIYVDTGAMYRAIGLYMLNNNIDANDEEAIKTALAKIEVGIEYVDSIQVITLNGENVNTKIRTEEVGMAASTFSAKPPVREKLLELQRSLAKKTDVIMDGRDIGTVILPNAFLKIYLTASSLERAKRRYNELIEKGMEADLNKIQADIIERDQNDMNRAVSPLRKAEDAVEVDASVITADEVVDEIISIFNKKKDN